TVWLGRYDTDAFAALSLAFPLIFFLISIGGGFTTAGSILVAQYTGAKSEASAGKVAGQTLSYVIGIAFILGLIGFLATDQMLAILPAEGTTETVVIPLAGKYMRIFFLGLPFLFGFFVFASLMRGYGNTRTPMRVMAISVAANVVLDPFLIFGWGPFPELGIEGAAIATIFSRSVATVIGLYLLFYTSAGPAVIPRHLMPDLSIVSKITRVGLPSAAEQSMSSVAMITLTGMVATFTPAVVAAYGIGNRLISLAFLPALGMGRATNTMVGQNLGAGKADRAESAVLLAISVSGGILLLVGIFAFTFPTTIVGAFISTGTSQAAETIQLGSEYVRIRSFEFLFMGVMQVLLGAYRGAGNTKTALAFSIVTLWIARVPTVFYLALDTTIALSILGYELSITTLGLGPDGIWTGMAVGHIVGAITAGLWFTRGTWRKAVVDEQKTSPSSGEEA
ncbi:MAG: MATE family efflux transporter, partial [Halobacteriaceae archaeon]